MCSWVQIHVEGACFVALLPQIAKFPPKPQNNSFKISKPIQVGVLPFFSNEGDNLSLADDLSGGLIKKINSILFF